MRWILPVPPQPSSRSTSVPARSRQGSGSLSLPVSLFSFWKNLCAWKICRKDPSLQRVASARVHLDDRYTFVSRLKNLL